MWFRSKLTWFLLIIVIAGAGFYLYSRPLPAARATSSLPAAPKTQAIALPWPNTGQAALGAQNYGLLETSNTDTPVPIASVAKVITALAILQKKPLAVGEQGPTLTLDSTDVDYYNSYFSQGGSVAKVSAGETISEYQALEALMLPSANNMADSLVRWAFGAPSAYVSYADQMLKDGGLQKTIVGDASGFGDNTTSTADDLVKIGLAALQNPVLSKIVAEPTAQLPVAGQVSNVNWLLGSDGVVGIKTGFTAKAGGCYLVAAKHQVSGQTVTLVSAVLGAPDLNSAISSAKSITQAADSGFENLSIVRQGQIVGFYKTAWGSAAQVKATKPVNLLVWKGKDIKITSDLEPLPTPAKAGAPIGAIIAQSTGQAAKSQLVLSNNLDPPSPIWRIFR